MDETKTTVKYGTNIIVWIALLALLWLTVSLSRMGLGRMNIAAPIAIATLKAFLVLAFFMHLKYEDRFLKYLIFITIGILIVTSWLIYNDVGYRG